MTGEIWLVLSRLQFDGVLTAEVCFSQPTMETYAVTTATYQRRALFVRTENAELLVIDPAHNRRTYAA